MRSGSSRASRRSLPPATCGGTPAPDRPRPRGREPGAEPYLALVFGLNRVVEGEETNLNYYEILNAQHLDALLPVPGFAAAFVPLHHYFLEALNLMWAHLTEGAPLPPSQVVRPSRAALGRRVPCRRSHWRTCRRSSRTLSRASASRSTAARCSSRSDPAKLMERASARPTIPRQAVSPADGRTFAGSLTLGLAKGRSTSPRSRWRSPTSRG